METQTFDLNEIFNLQTSEDHIKDATAFRTLPSGKYRLTTVKMEGRIASDQSPWPGARMIHLQVSAESPERKSTLFLDLSPEPLFRDKDGKQSPDGPYKLWLQYVKAVDCVGKDAGEVVEAIKLYPVDSVIVESFKMPDGTRKYPRNPVEVKAAVDAGGAEPKNYVQNVFAAK